MAESTTQNNGKFARFTVAFCILGIVYMFMYSGLQNDQINIINAFSAWNTNLTLAPMTIGNLVCIALSFVYGSLFVKVGPKKTVIPCNISIVWSCAGFIRNKEEKNNRIKKGDESSSPLVCASMILSYILPEKFL